MRADVQKLYSRLANWYDAFRGLWVVLTSRQAERDLDSLFVSNVTPESAILDLGCGTGVNVGRLLRLGLGFRQYEGIDFTESMLAVARRKYGHVPKVTFSRGDVTALEDTGRRYDVIVSTYVLSHLRRPAAFVNDVQRLLRPGGHLLLLFYSRPRWSLRFWMVPLGKALFRADAVRHSEVASFANVGTRRTYFAGAVTLLGIAAPAAGAEAVPSRRVQQGRAARPAHIG